MGLRGRGLILLGNKPASGPDLSGFLLYDNFQGAPASIIGRVPNKGAAWTATGAAAANITTIIPTGQQALPISNQPPFTANGRIQGTLTMTSSGLGSFAIAMGPSLSGAGGCTVNNLLLLKNPPTTI